MLSKIVMHKTIHKLERDVITLTLLLRDPACRDIAQRHNDFSTKFYGLMFMKAHGVSIY
jgi:hypothetical protein